MTRKMWSRGSSSSSGSASAASVTGSSISDCHRCTRSQPTSIVRSRPSRAVRRDAIGSLSGQVEVAGQQVPRAQRDEPHRDPGADEPLGHRAHRPVPADRDDDVRALRDRVARLTDPGVRDGRLEPQRLGQPLLRAGRVHRRRAARGRPAWRGWRRTRRAARSPRRPARAAAPGAPGPDRGDSIRRRSSRCRSHRIATSRRAAQRHDGRAHGHPRLPGHGPNLRPAWRRPGAAAPCGPPAGWAGVGGERWVGRVLG